MSAKTPIVSDGTLFDPAAPATPIRLDTPAWAAWLEAPTTRRFAYPLFDPAVGYRVGVMTVRKEARQRGTEYWTAYRRAGPHLRKVYLGRSATVTQARLQAVAEHIRTADAQSREPDPPPDSPTAQRPPYTEPPQAPAASFDVTGKEPLTMDNAVPGY
jgi:hypothetical protein